MAFCMKCGKEIPKGADYCPKCGAQLGVVSQSEKKEKDYSGTGGTLLLVGGILAIVFALFPLAFMGLMRRWMWMPGMWGEWGMPMAIGSWIAGFMVVGAIVSILLGIIAIYAYRKIGGGEVKTGGTIGIVLGVIMLFTLNWIPGILTLIGGILCYTSK